MVESQPSKLFVAGSISVSHSRAQRRMAVGRGWAIYSLGVGLLLLRVTPASSYLSWEDRRVPFGFGPEVMAGGGETHWPGGISQFRRDAHVAGFPQVNEPVPAGGL